MTVNVNPVAPICTASLPSPPFLPSTSRSPATPEEAEQYDAGLTLQQPRYPPSQECHRTSSIPIHSLSCTPSGYISASQMDLPQGVSRDQLRESPQITVPDPPKAGSSSTQRAPLLSPDSASILEEGRETSGYYSSSGEPNTASEHTQDTALSQAERRSVEEENLESIGSDGDEDGIGEEKTKAERLAEKRQMKRFRLTHAQTRYLMSKFACQAHPDAKQRERLSRDIPGLNPRQVQVWFQNRRAKLKRLTTDDQERMMRSRALPDDYDFTHTLRPAYGKQDHSIEPVASSSNLRLTDGGRRPTPTLRQDHQGPYPIDASSVYTNIPHSGGSASGSFSLSPVSSLNDGLYEESHYSTSAYSGMSSPTTTSPFTSEFCRSNSFSTSSISQRQTDKILQGGVNQLGAKSLVTRMTQSGTTSAGSAYGYRETPSRSSPAPMKDQGINRRLSPSVSLADIPPIYEQSSPQYSPAAGSAGYPSYSIYHTGHVDINTLQSGEMERLAQLGQFLRQHDQAVNPSRPPASSDNYHLPPGTMDDAALLGQQRIYTEPDIRCFPAAAEQPVNDASPRRRTIDTYPMYNSNQR